MNTRARRACHYQSLLTEDYSGLDLRQRAEAEFCVPVSGFSRIGAELRGGQTGGVEEIGALGVVRPRVARGDRQRDFAAAEDDGRAVDSGLGGKIFSVGAGDLESFQRAVPGHETALAMGKLDAHRAGFERGVGDLGAGEFDFAAVDIRQRFASLLNTQSANVLAAR